jgi:hypothetical protein
MKHSYEYVKGVIESEEYILVSSEYVNSKTKLDMVCPNGHDCSIRYNDFQQGHRCSKCYGNKKYSVVEVSELLKGKGYTLVSTTYKSNIVPLETLCPKGHQYFTSLNNVLNGYGCPVCEGNKRLELEEVRKRFASKGYKLLSMEYTNNAGKLDVLCDKGHQWSTTLNNFMSGNQCSSCYPMTSVGEKEVVSLVKELYEGCVVENDRTTVRNPRTGRFLELDILLPDINKAVEYNGKHWHQDIEREKIKVDGCERLGIDLLIIEDSEWKRHKQQAIEKVRRHICG